MQVVFTFILIATWPSHVYSLELIAHRGVHQTYTRDGLNDETCTANRIEKIEHQFIENTVDSVRQAFELGATMVEIDIHPTQEVTGEDRMIVFHDWTLDCRTEARCATGCKCEDGNCVTHLQSIAYLKTLDLGYGYTSDGGQTFPFRGKFKNQMPTLEEVLDVLTKFSDRKLLVNWKDRFPKTVEIFLRIVSKYPENVRKRIYFEYHNLDPKQFKELHLQEAIYQGGGPAKECFKKYFLYGWTGYFPKACQNTRFFVPLRERMGRFGKLFDRFKATDLIWGWPHEFIDKARQHGTQIYISQVDSEEELAQVIHLPIAGIMTNKIGLIAPLLPNHSK